MSIAAKHAYRFVYLRSDAWDSVRLEALVREHAQCQICGEESIHNDAHHAVYPESVWDTKEHDLIVLCRHCHTLVHRLLELNVTVRDNSDRGYSFARFLELVTVLSRWRMSRMEYFQSHCTKTKKGSRRPNRLLESLDSGWKKLRCAVCLRDDVDVKPTRVIEHIPEATMKWNLCKPCHERATIEIPAPTGAVTATQSARKWLASIHQDRPKIQARSF